MLYRKPFRSLFSSYCCYTYILIALQSGPAIPELSSPVAVTATTVNISWSEQPDNHSDYRVIDHYELHAIPVAGSCNAIGDISAIVSGTTTHHVLSGLEETTTYAITISAVNNLGRSDTSMEMEVATRPTGITTTLHDCTIALLVWAIHIRLILATLG